MGHYYRVLSMTLNCQAVDPIWISAVWGSNDPLWVITTGLHLTERVNVWCKSSPVVMCIPVVGIANYSLCVNTSIIIASAITVIAILIWTPRYRICLQTLTIGPKLDCLRIESLADS